MPDYSLFGDDHVRQYEATGGKVGHEWNGTTCLVLHTLGRKTRETRKFPLIYGRDGEAYVVVASKGGAPEHPAWYYNLRANPSFEIEALVDGEVVTVPVTATEIVGDAWQEAYGAIAAEEPQFGGYLEKTDRRIPVFQLTPRQE